MRLRRGLLTSLFVLVFALAASVRMEARPEPQATGQLPGPALTPATFSADAPASEPARAASETRTASSFAIRGTPFTGIVPGSCAAHLTDGGTLLIEGVEGDARQASIELQVAPKATSPGTIDDLSRLLRAYLSTHEAAQVNETQRTDAHGAAARVITASYRVPTPEGAADLRQMTLVLEYPEHFVVFSYYNRTEYFERHLPLFKEVVEGFRHRTE